MIDSNWNAFLYWLFPKICSHMRARGFGERWMKLVVEESQQ